MSQDPDVKNSEIPADETLEDTELDGVAGGAIDSFMHFDPASDGKTRVQ